MDWLGAIIDIIKQQDNIDRLRLLFVLLLGMAGFSLAFALAIVVSALFSPVKKRIDKVRSDDNVMPNEGIVNNLLNYMGKVIIPKADEKRSKVAYKLETAGYRSTNYLAYFYGSKFLGFVLMPFVILGGVTLLTSKPALEYLSIAILAGVTAFFIPNLWLKRMIRSRQQQLRHGLPDALDLMVVCAEAGLGLNAAISRVANEIEVQHPELADELHLVMMQTRAGMDNSSALRELERRTGLDDISAFVTTLLQAMRFGTSIGQSLRVFSDEMRDKRLQHAQEKAARLSLTMLMPIVICMLPMFFLILLGPAILSMMTSVTKLTGG